MSRKMSLLVVAAPGSTFEEMKSGIQADINRLGWDVQVKVIEPEQLLLRGTRVQLDQLLQMPQPPPDPFEFEDNLVVE